MSKKYRLFGDLQDCTNEGYKPLFMPKVIEIRIANARQNKKLWDKELITPSVAITGRTNKGNPVVVVAHKESYLSNHSNLREGRTSENLHKHYNRFNFPEREFQNLVEEDGLEDEQRNRLVWVIDYEKLKAYEENPEKKRKIEELIKARSLDECEKITKDLVGVSIEKVLEHPLTIPFIGEERRSIDYIKANVEVYGGDKIGVWYHPCLGLVDNANNKRPLGDLLMLGNHAIGGISANHYKYDHRPLFLGTSL